LLEERLEACVPRGLTVEVINFGVSAYSTAQELLTYRQHASLYRPDVVLQAVYTGNDIYNNHPKLNESRHLPTPYAYLQNGRLHWTPPEGEVEDADAPWYRRWRLIVTGYVRTADVLYSSYGVARARLRLGRDPYTARAQESDLPDSEEVYRPPATPEAHEAWAATEALLRTLAAEVATQGAEFLMVTLSNAEQVHPDLSVRRHFAESFGVADLLYPDRRLHDFAATNGIAAVTLVEPLAGFSAARGVFLNGGYSPETPPGTGHWNLAANTLAAEVAGQRLCSRSRSLAPLSRGTCGDATLQPRHGRLSGAH